MTGTVHNIRPGASGSDNHGGGGHNGGNGSPPGEGKMEARVTALEGSVGRLEQDVSEIKQAIRDIRSDSSTHFRWVIGVILSLALGSTGAIFSFKSDLYNTDMRMAKTETTVQMLVEKSAQTERKLDGIDARLNQVDKRLDRLEMRMDSMEATLQDIKKAVTK